MEDQRSVEMLAFNFASRTFAYKRLNEGLSSSVSASSSFIRELLDYVIKVDQCAQYVDDLGIAANNTTDPTRNIRTVFHCICQAELKMTIEKCFLEVENLNSLAELFHAKKYQHKLTKFKTSSTN